MNIIRPRFIALDSSHLATLARDMNSPDGARRKAATAFLESFGGSGGILVLGWHHFEELLRYGDSAVVAQRVAFFQSLPMVASIARATDDDAPGSIVDILTFEAVEAFKAPHADAVAIRDQVRRILFRCGTGRTAIAPYAVSLQQMRAEFRRREEYTREIIAISRSRYIDIGRTKVVDWLKGRWREPEDAERRLAIMSQRLADDIRQRGDKRIQNASMTATRFMDSVRSNAGMARSARKYPPPDKLLPEDVDLSEIGPDMTLDDMGDLAAFRRRLRLVNDNILGLPWLDLKARVAEARLPSGVIQSGLRRHRQDFAERKGSELIDQYLACLAPYADVTYVDKRVHEAVTRARRASPEFAAVLRRVEKAGSYADIARHLVN